MRPFPWHFWPLVALAFVWYLCAAVDYAATRAEWAPWLAYMSERQETFVETMPVWVDAAWGIGVWFGLAGTLLVAGRVGIAPIVLAASAAALTAMTVWLSLFSVPSLLSLAGPLGLAILIGTSLFAILFWIYARALHREGLV